MSVQPLLIATFSHVCARLGLLTLLNSGKVDTSGAQPLGSCLPRAYVQGAQ